MKAYIVYILSDYAHVAAITTDKKKACDHANELHRITGYCAWVDIITVGSDLVEFE